MILRNYGDYIRKNRIILKLSQKELAKKLNVTEASVSKWESDMMRLELNNLVSLANIFGVSIDDFLNLRYLNGFDIKDKYPFLHQINMGGKYLETNIEHLANEFVNACNNMYELIKKYNENSINDMEKVKLEQLIKLLVEHIDYEEYQDASISRITGLEYESGYYNKFVASPSLVDLIGVLNNDEYINKRVYYFFLELFITKLTNKSLLISLMDYIVFNYNLLIDAINNKNWNLVHLCVLNGVKLKDEKMHQRLIYKLMLMMGDF